jgi:cell division initiation protein
MPPLTPLDIQHKEFTKAMRGYAMHEVDTFLDQVTEEFTRMQDEIARLREQASSAAPPHPPPG